MEAVSRWLCGFYADKVTIQRHRRTVTCGDKVLLCSIKLTDPNSNFTNYHENKITVLYHGRNAEAVGDCKLYITKVNSRQLDVFCYARRAGRATVKVDLGKWYQVEGDQDLNIDIVPSTPHYVNDVRFTTHGAIDESFSADPTVMYRNQWSILEAEMVDRYNNVVCELSNDYNIGLLLFDDKGKVIEMEYKDVEFQNKRLRVQMKISEAGKYHLAIILLSRNSHHNQVVRLQEIQVQVNDAPLYLAGSKFLHPKTCVAGKEIQLEVLPFDVFGCPLSANSTTDCNLTEDILNLPLKLSENEETTDFKITKQDSNETRSIFVQKPSSKTAIKEHKKVNIKKINTPENLSFTVAVCFKIAGLRKLRLIVHSGSKSSSKDIYVKVLSSTPHYVNDVRFTTHGAIDESFSADPTVMYRNQWSILEAEMVDCYDNVVRELSNDYNIDLQLCNNEGKEMEYKDVEFRNERLRVQVKINEAGKHNLAITVTNRNNHDQVIRLQGIQIQVNDAPLYLAGSKFLHPKTCVAGKEIQLEVLPFDVFGCPLPATSTTDCNLTGDISNSLLKLGENKKTTDFKITKQDSNETHSIFVQAPSSKTAIKQHRKEQINIKKINATGNLSFAVTVCFKIAGLRKLRLIVHSGSKSSFKYIDVKVLPSTPDHFSDVKFTTHGAIDESFSADPTVVYRNQWSILEAEMVDCYDNVVRELSNDYNIGLKLSDDKGKEMEYKDMEFQNERLRVQMKINEAGKHTLLITLTNKSSQDQEVVRLQEIQIQVNDTPLYLAGSKFFHPVTCLAGKKIQLEIRPLDVFGCALPADSTTDCNLTGDFLNLALELNENKETMDFRRLKNESDVVIRVSIVLTKAGRRKVRIIDKDNKSKELSIQVNPDVNDVHWELTAPKETAYRREKLILAVRLFDCFNNEVRTDALENLIPQLIKRDGPDGLRFTEEFNNKVAIHCYFKQIGKYDLCLADRDGTCLEGTSFLITVQDAPLDYHNSTIEWIPQYDDLPDQPVFPEDETFQCCLRLKDVVGYDYDTKIAKGCIKVKYGNTEMKNIKVSSCPNDVASYNIVVPSKNLVKDDANPRFWCFVNGRKIEQPLILPTFEGFEKYDDDSNCVIEHRRYEFVRIVCYGVTRNDIIGSDYAHLNNIKRVCELYDDPEVETCQDEDIDDDFVEYGDDEPIGAEGGGNDDYNYDYDADDYDNDDNDDDYGDDDDPTTIIELPLEEIVYDIESWDWIIICTLEEIEHKIQDCRNILLHLLRAIFYRKEAFELDKDREDWKERASKNYRKIEKGDDINKNLPRFCSQIKEKYARLMRRYHDAACDEFFQFFNAKRDQSEIDLHGLLVVDEKKLWDYERQLRSRGRMSLDQVERKIEEERDHGNEAIRKLRERLDNYDKKKAKEEGEPWLEIIVGSGHHSKVRQNTKVRQRIRPKVEEYLKKRKKTRKFSPVNKGALVVTFEKYTGSEPCFGEYYCTRCDNRWRNGRSWIGKWQACYDCYDEEGLLEKCYPLKQRCRRKRQSYNPNIVSRNQRPFPEHLEKLCEKCIELGRPCPRA